MADIALSYQPALHSGLQYQDFGMENPHASLDRLMERLRNKSGQMRGWLETTKALKVAFLDKRHQVDSAEKPQIQHCLDQLHTAVKVSSLQGMVERLEAITRQVGLKFTAGLSGSDVYISTDMFYMELHLEASGGVKDIQVTHRHDGDSTTYPELTKLLSDGDFAEFTEHLEGLADVYKITGDKKQKTKAFLALQWLDHDLNLLAQLQSSISGVSNYIHKSPLGILQPRNGGRPMKLIYFVAPYDLLNEKKRTSYSLTVEAITDNKLGHSMTIGLESSTPRILQTMPLMTVNKTADGKGLPHFSALSNLNSCSLPACFVMNLQKPIPVALHVIKKIQSLTGVDFVDLNSVQPLISLLVHDVSKGKIEISAHNNNNRGHFVTMPDQQHCYFLNGMNGMGDLKAALVTRIPFTHPTHVPHIIIQLRQQLLFNTVVGSCVRPNAKQDIQESIMFEVTPLSLQHITVAFEHPLKDSMATVEFDLSDVTNVRCKLCTFDDEEEEENFCSNDYICKVIQRSLSIPVTTRAILRKASSKLNEQHPPITLVLSKVGEQRRHAFTESTRNHKQAEAAYQRSGSLGSLQASQTLYSSAYSDITADSYESLEHGFNDPNMTPSDIAEAINADKISRNPMLASLLDQDTASPEPQATPTLSTLLGDEASKLPNPMAMPPKNRKKSMKRKSASDSRSPGSGKSPKRKPSEEDFQRDYQSVEFDGGGSSVGGSVNSSPYDVSMHSASTPNSQHPTPPQHNMIVNMVEEVPMPESHVLKLASSVDSFIKQETKANCVIKQNSGVSDLEVPNAASLPPNMISKDMEKSVLPNHALLTTIKKENTSSSSSLEDVAPNNGLKERPLDSDLFTSKEGTFTPTDFIGSNKNKNKGSSSNGDKYESAATAAAPLDFNTELLNPDTNFTDSLMDSGDQSEDMDLEACDANAFGTGINPAAIVASKLVAGGSTESGVGSSNTAGSSSSSKSESKKDHSKAHTTSSLSFSSSKHASKERSRDSIKKEKDFERESSSKREVKDVVVKEERVKEKGALTMKLSTKDFNKDSYTKVSKLVNETSSSRDGSTESPQEALDLSKGSKEYKLSSKEKLSVDQEGKAGDVEKQPPITTTISVGKQNSVSGSSSLPNKTGKPLAMAADMMNMDHVKKYKIQKSDKNKKKSSKYGEDDSTSSSGKRKKEERKDKSSKKRRLQELEGHNDFTSSSHGSVRSENSLDKKLDHLSVMKPTTTIKITGGKVQIKHNNSPVRIDSNSSSSSPSKSLTKPSSSSSSSSSQTASGSSSSSSSSSSHALSSSSSSSSSSSGSSSKVSTIIKVPSSEKDRSLVKTLSSSSSSSSSSSYPKSSNKVGSLKSPGRVKGISSQSSLSMSKDTKLSKTPTIKLKPIVIPGDRSTFTLSSASSTKETSAPPPKQTTAPSTPTTPSGGSLASKSPVKSRKPSLLAVINKLNNKAGGIAGVTTTSPLPVSSPLERKEMTLERKDSTLSVSADAKKEKDVHGVKKESSAKRDSSTEKKEGVSSSTTSSSSSGSKRDSTSSESKSKGDSGYRSSSSSSNTPTREVTSSGSQKAQEKGSSSSTQSSSSMSSSSSAGKNHDHTSKNSNSSETSSFTSTSSSSVSATATASSSSSSSSLSSSSKSDRSEHRRSDSRSSDSKSQSNSSSSSSSTTSGSSNSSSKISKSSSGSSSSASSSGKDSKHSCHTSSRSSSSSSSTSQGGQKSSDTASSGKSTSSESGSRSSTPLTSSNSKSNEVKSHNTLSNSSSSSSSVSTSLNKERDREKDRAERDKEKVSEVSPLSKSEKNNRKSKLEDIADKLQTRHFTDIMTKINGSNVVGIEKREKGDTMASKSSKDKEKDSSVVRDKRTNGESSSSKSKSSSSAAVVSDSGSRSSTPVMPARTPEPVSSESKTGVANHDHHKNSSSSSVNESEESKADGSKTVKQQEPVKLEHCNSSDNASLSCSNDTVFKAPTPKNPRTLRDGDHSTTEKIAVAPRSRSESSKSSRQNLSPRSDASSPEDGLVIDCPTTPNHRARSPLSRDPDSSPTAGLVIDCPYSSSPLSLRTDASEAGELLASDANSSGNSIKSVPASSPQQKSPVVRLSPLHSPAKSPLPKSNASSASNHSPCSIDDDLMDEALMGFGQ